MRRNDLRIQEKLVEYNRFLKVWTATHCLSLLVSGFIVLCDGSMIRSQLERMNSFTPGKHSQGYSLGPQGTRRGASDRIEGEEHQGEEGTAEATY